jgi:hypothetical protein
MYAIPGKGRRWFRGSGFGGSGFRGSGFKVQGSGFKVLGSGFWVQRFRETKKMNIEHRMFDVQ